MRLMLDTDICIYLLRGAIKRAEPVALEGIGISVITLGELEDGVHRAQHSTPARARLEVLLAAIEIVPLPLAAGRLFGELRATLGRSGFSLGVNDLWIATHALALKVPLATRNLREFDRVPGLIIEDWGLRV